MDEPLIDDRIASYYGQGVESGRLLDEDGSPRLELVRTLELFERFAPEAPADVLDVGGGPGLYAALLASRGYRVRLIDAVELHVRQAAEASAAQPEHSFEVTQGDARRLDEADESYDIVLLLGPLYHLVDRGDRVRALAEARRVLRPGGLVFAAAISRFASLFDGLRFDRFGDPAFVEVVERDLRDGQHRSPDDREELFTTAFFHKPDELATEVGDGGLELVTLVSLEGPGWLIGDRGKSPEEREVFAWAARAVEDEPTLLGLGPHLLAIARRT
jgi:SAM-dependent methyltransferase